MMSIFILIGKRAWLWIALISVYSTICFFFSKAPLFSSIYCSWFFQPLIGYVVDSENLVNLGFKYKFPIFLKYANYLHSTHDIFMAIAFPFVYLLLGLRLAYVSHQSAVPNVERTVSQRKAKFIIFLRIIPKFEDVFASGHHFRIQLLFLPPLRGHAIHRGHRIPYSDGPIWMVGK